MIPALSSFHIPYLFVFSHVFDPKPLSAFGRHAPFIIRSDHGAYHSQPKRGPNVS
ncbi:hypothetical protein Brsp07_01333 [Brucella sp. NBRC 14130]|nr:hypothetical protein [Ochrobactrum sp. RH1CCR137]MBA8854001.1 hypothetical protein [Ochrobactrum sp. RH1CCR134]